MNSVSKATSNNGSSKTSQKENYLNQIWLSIILAVALIIRIGMFSLVAGETAKYYSNPDAYEYEKISLNLLKYGIFADGTKLPLTPNIYRTPVYPVMLAGVYSATNGSSTAAVLVQALIGSVAAALIFLLSLKLNLPRSVGVIASFVVISDPLTLLTTFQLITETLFTALLLLAILFLADYANTAKVSSLVLASAFLAASALTRPIGQYLPLVFLPLVWKSGRQQHHDWKINLGRTFLFLSISLLLIQAWAYRNYRQAGIWTLSAISDKNLYYYRALDVIAKAENVSEEKAEQELTDYIQEERTKENLTEAQTIALMRQKAVSIFRQYPVQTLEVHVIGLAKVIVNPGLGLICVMLNRQGDLSGCAAGDVSNSLGKLATKFSDMDNLQITMAVWAIVLLFMVYILAGIGVYYLIRQSNWLVLAFSLFPIFYFSLLSAGGESDSRFRIPFLPFLGILAGVGLMNLIHNVRRP